MTAGNTYTPLATTTLPSDQNTITFNSISGSYTDLVLVMSFTYGSGTSAGIRFNNDSGTNYSWTYMFGSGSAPTSASIVSDSIGVGYLNSTSHYGTVICNIMNYAGSKYKGVLTANLDPQNRMQRDFGYWNSTAAITRLDIIGASSGVFTAGSTFTLYGIAAA